MSYIRPKQFKTEVCHTCYRDGWKHEVHKDLLTEGEYKSIFTKDTMEDIPGLPGGFEKMEAKAGSSIGSAIEEAKQYCKDYSVKGVGFMFNGEAVFVTAKSNVEKVYRDWWIRLYKETPEESFKRR